MKHVVFPLGGVLLIAGSAFAQPQPTLVPREITGFSTIEQRNVYADPDKGTWEFPLRIGFTAAGEVSIEEPSMCEGQASAKVEYDRAANTVKVSAHYEGLPYRMSAAFEEDRSTPYNQFPVSVEDGKWQLWFVGQLFSQESIFWYDGFTGQLIANEHDIDVSELPPQAFPVPLPVVHMACITDLFESDPDTLVADVEVTKNFDQIVDAAGTGGVLVGYVPYNLFCAPDTVGPYYTTGGLSLDYALSFDDVLASVNGGYGFALATSLEPDPKPDYIFARDNIMIGWTGGYPAVTPEGMRINTLTGEAVVDDSCYTREQPKWPAGYYNFCGPL